jgi:hypothetical protein
MHKKPRTNKIPTEQTRLRIHEVSDYIFKKYDSIIGDESVRWWIKKGIKVGKKRLLLKAIKIGTIWFVSKQDLEDFLLLYKRTKN